MIFLPVYTFLPSVSIHSIMSLEYENKSVSNCPPGGASFGAPSAAANVRSKADVEALIVEQNKKAREAREELNRACYAILILDDPFHLTLEEAKEAVAKEEKKLKELQEELEKL